MPAIILTSTDVRPVPLPGMNSSGAPAIFQDDIERHRNASYNKPENEISTYYDIRFLSWLWSSCVKDVFKAIEFGKIDTRTRKPRMWWIGSGAAGSLPFHAAGINDSDNDSALDRSVPSYTPSIRMLIHAQSRGEKHDWLFDSKPTLTVVAMPQTPGEKKLPGVTLEKEKIVSIVKHAFEYKEFECPSAEEVLRNLGASNMVHFACHGSSNSISPLKSHLLLQKMDGSHVRVDKLRVSDIAGSITQGRAWLVFLSVCSAAEVTAKRLTDEGLHLASAFQVIGFPHVISSLGRVADDICVKLAESFYRSLLRAHTEKYASNRVAHALRDAVIKLRDSYPSKPEYWAVYAHFEI